MKKKILALGLSIFVGGFVIGECQAAPISYNQGAQAGINGDYSWDIQLDPAGFGALESATFTIEAFGLGYYSPATLSISGLVIGDLTSGEDVGQDGTSTSYSRLDSFDLTNLGIDFFSTPLTISINTHQAGISMDSWDLTSFSLDLLDTVGGGEPVPEPATLFLFGTGVAGLIAARRKSN